MDEQEPTQRTEQGLKAPVPTREHLERDSAKIAPPVPPKPKKKHRKRIEDAADRERARQRSGEGV
jgi:hypothetical protein